MLIYALSSQYCAASQSFPSFSHHPSGMDHGALPGGPAHSSPGWLQRELRTALCLTDLFLLLEMSMEQDAPRRSAPRALPPDISRLHPSHKSLTLLLLLGKQTFFGGNIWFSLKAGMERYFQPQIRNRIIIKSVVLEGVVCVIPQQ